MGKEYSHQQSVLENWTFMCKKIFLDPHLTPYTKSTQQIKFLNIRPETVKLLEENIREIFHGIALGIDFMSMTPKSQATLAKYM